MSTKSKTRIQYAVTTASGARKRGSALTSDKSSLKPDRSKGERISRYYEGAKFSL